MLTPKQILFFEPMIERLKKNHSVLCTSRKYNQVTELAKIRKQKLVVIGKHGGAEKHDKLDASLSRSKLLVKKITKFSPDITLSFCSPEASRIAFRIGIPHIAFSDSPQAKAVMQLSLPYVTKLLTPWIIPKQYWKEFGISQKNIIRYKSIDASVIIKNYDKNKNIKRNAKKIILIRPEEEQAAYITKKSQTVKIIQKIVEDFPNERKVVLSRYKNQTEQLKRIFGEKIVLFSKPVNGRELLKNVDCFVGSGGTMTAEAGLLGIPTISLNSVPNRIEDFLVRKKVIVRSSRPEMISKEIFQSLSNALSVRKRKSNAKKILTSFEDPYQVLLKTIKSL